MLLNSPRILIAASGLSLLALVGCRVDWEPDGPPRTESRSVELDKSELVHVRLRMGAGEMRVNGGATNLMDAEFHYSRPSLKPEVRYDPSSFRGNLTVEEPRHAHYGGDYRWDLRFNNDKPMDLDVEFGAGEGRLDLGSLALRDVEVHMGVGRLQMDLRGTPKSDYTVNVHGGVGEATIYLPSGVGVVADAKGGIGGINASHLENRDGRYVNTEYGHSKVTVRLNVHGGIGAINLVGG